MTTGYQIKRFRLRRKWSQQGLADHLKEKFPDSFSGDQAEISEIENGKETVIFCRLIKILEVLGAEFEISEYDVLKSLEAQRDLCKNEKIPLFAPYSGICFFCSKQIYTVINLKIASEQHIVTCPNCQKSFV